MSLSVSTDLICGALVDMDRELCVQSQSISYRCERCARCHEGGMKFCGECGLKFELVKVVKWAPRAVAYFAKHGILIREDDVPWYDHDLGAGPFYNVVSPSCSEDARGRETWVIGVELPSAKVSMRDYSFPRTVSIAAVREAVEKVDSMVREFELTKREISLFPRMYVSV